MIDTTYSTLVTKVKALCKFPNDAESTRIISGLRWIGLFSSEKVKPRAGNLLDTLCAQLETLMKYDEGERDLVMLQHKFIVEWSDGSEVYFLSAIFNTSVRVANGLLTAANVDLDFGGIWFTIGSLRHGFDCWLTMWYRYATHSGWRSQACAGYICAILERNL